jgi:predicted regulator of amino acid metabolism with ACT domain
MKRAYTTIPVELCAYALLNQKVNPIRLYAYLKLHASGHLRYERDIFEHIKDWAEDLSIHKKTVQTCLQWLIDNKLVTINSNLKSIRIIGYEQLHRKFKFENKSAVVLEEKGYLHFKAFCCAAVIIYYRNKKRWLDCRSASKKGGARKNLKQSNRGFYPLPCEYLAKCLNVSKTTAFNYKVAAATQNFIEKKKNIVPVFNNVGDKMPREIYSVLERMDSDIITIGRFRKGKKFLRKVDSDLIGSNIIIKTKKYR